MAKSRSLRWGPKAEVQVDHYVKTFNDGLRRVALRFAHHGRADTVDAFHVDEAFEAMVRFGLQREVWWKRPQLKITAGALLLGVALAIPDHVPLIFEEAGKQRAVAVGTEVACFILAAACYAWGWLQNRG